MAKTQKSINFEKTLGQLQDIVDALEAGDQSLEQSLKSFEQGISLTRQCREALDDAEQKIVTLTTGDNSQQDS